jgi:5-methylcytosine-specific restriction endonuclease McrA
MITSALRKKVWDKEFGTQLEAKCPIQHCTSMLFKEQDSAFHCGHIMPKCRGGEDTIENLRPICANCNARMGCRHWDEYEKTVG